VPRLEVNGLVVKSMGAVSDEVDGVMAGRQVEPEGTGLGLPENDRVLTLAVEANHYP